MMFFDHLAEVTYSPQYHLIVGVNCIFVLVKHNIRAQCKHNKNHLELYKHDTINIIIAYSLGDLVNKLLMSLLTTTSINFGSAADNHAQQICCITQNKQVFWLQT